MIKDPIKRRASQKIYRDNHKKEARYYSKEWNLKNRDRVKEQKRKYYLEHKDKWRERGNPWYWDNKEKRFEYIKGYCVKNIRNWIVYLQSKIPNPICEVCGKELKYFNGKDGVHFDHRRGNEYIKEYPSRWMRRMPCTEKNIEKFVSCDFGILCNGCNRILPTIGRDQFMRRLVKYVYGNELETHPE